MHIKVTLSIGLAAASQSEILDIPDSEVDACESVEQLEKLKQGYYEDWANNHIDGGYQEIT